MATIKKRSVAELTRSQLANEIARNALSQVSNLADGIRDLLHKGKAIDARTRQPVQLRCTPADIKKALSVEQRHAIEDFIAKWATEPQPEPAAGARKRVVIKG